MKLLPPTLSACILAAATLLTGASAHAQSNYTLYGPGTGYVGLNAGQSNFSLGSGAGGFPSDKHDTVYSIYGGSYFSDNFGAELGYSNFGKVTRAGGETKAEGFNLSLIGKMPLGPQFNLLGKLGTTYGRTDVSSNPASGIASGSESGFGVSYGVGAEYAFTPQMSVMLQYDEHSLKFPGSGRDRIGATTAGFRYRF